MRLSRLHINGFKSFPDRAELGFDQGVTAIVGPNGCGKSNVVDAITWVLGEQSAKSLRGERMEDIIFNGSDARKPTATAEVRLKLADVAQVAMPALTGPPSDQFLDEQPLITRNVEIGRRLYRSGESEYLIDGEICRLRDIHDLLMDSGLGVKAYAVIEQGKIGQILSSRPAERRNLIEEAAGVTKYKSRRRAAELKLEAARQNLTRIDDIIFEVEKQRSALKRQAARARRYKRLREELRRWEQVQLARRHATLSQEIQAADMRLGAARDRETAARAHVSELETRLARIRLDLTDAESKATETREQAHARELEIGRRQQQMQFDHQQVEDLGRRLEAFAAEANELIGRRGPAHAAIETQRDAQQRARVLLEQAAGHVDHCQAAYSRALTAVQQAEQAADETRAAVLASTTTLSALRQARDNAADARDRAAAERSRLDVEGRDLEQEAARARAGRDEAAQALAQARSLLDAAVQRRSEIEADLARRRMTRDDLSEALTIRQRDLAGHEARLHSLEELNNRRATFGDAARYLLAEPAASVRHHGAVADHLDVERSYERAVDALLSDLLQHVLVETHEDVEQALVRLVEADAGRCGFVVLQDTPPASLPVAVERPAGARTLRDVARARGPHAASIAALLGDALIADSFDAARQLAVTTNRPVATLGGEVFRGPGVIEGGARRDAHGILEMRGDIERRRDELKQVAADVHHLANEMFGLDLAIGRAENALADRVDAQHAQEKVIVAAEGQMARHEDDLARLTRRLQVVDTERRRAGEEERTADGRREEASAGIAEYEAQQRGAEGKLGEVMAHLTARREEAEAATRLVTEARTEQATLSERVAGLQTEIVRLEEGADELEARIAVRQEEMQRAEARRLELRQTITETAALLDDVVRDLEGLRHQVREADESVVSCREDFGVHEHQIRGARHSLEAIRSEVTQYEVARATAAADLAHLASTCFEAVSASIEDVVLEVARMEHEGELAASGKRLAAISAPDEDEGGEGAEAEPRPTSLDAVDAAASSDSLRGGLPAEAASDASDPRRLEPRNLGTSEPEEIISDLRHKIDRLGPVNMMAIEQFDDLETRHTFLTSQRKDLLDSIGQTNEAIRKIDKTTRERFEEAFSSINTNFAGTFTTLFGGGRAGLVLIDQDNDPESGIDIIAQPPGKRLQNVQLLSGGEKALTAMALMFAIFKYRPSPFCLLDEIDAPLDDANIGRFVDMLRGMQAHTQFILITHNRKTMEIANRLYGVTMEEPGVSKLISLQLN